MTRAAPLPRVLANGPFAVAQAFDEGVSISRLRADDLIIPTRGVRMVRTTPPQVDPDETASVRLKRLREELLECARRIAPALTPEQFFSHETGLAAIGAPLPYTAAGNRAVHLAARHPSAKPRRNGTVGHRLQQRTPALRSVQGLQIEHPARLWRQAATLWELDDLIAAGDHLINPKMRLTTFEALRREVERHRDVRGGLLTRALSEIRIGAETAEETRLRLILIRAGLPEPELNLDLLARGGRFVARLDLAYPRYRLAIEHDGRTHAYNDQQFARDADRWDDIRRQGWEHVRILSHHLRPDPDVAVAKVTEALIRAGWRPSLRSLA